MKDDFPELVDRLARNKSGQVLRKRGQLAESICQHAILLRERVTQILSHRWINRVMSAEHREEFSRMQKSLKTKLLDDELLATWLLAEGELDSRSSDPDLLPEEESTEDSLADVSLAQGDGFGEDGELSYAEPVWSNEHFFKEQAEQEVKKEDTNPKDTLQGMTLKEIEEELMKQESGIDEFFHLGVWNLEDETKCHSSSAIFSKLQKQFVFNAKPQEYNREIVARLDTFKEEILKAKALTDDEVASVKKMWSLHRHRRWMLYAFWSAKVKSMVEKELRTFFKQYKAQMLDVVNERECESEAILRKAFVIGATTTGAAKNRSLLERIGCPIVIVEEAAEVLEAHVLASIPSKCEHAILIGDHQQLRPNPSVYELAREYDLEISMFERLVNNKFPYSTLDVQHRMRPLISRTLMRSTFYSNLEDADSVENYPEVKGANKSLYMICHHEAEAALAFDSTSHRNDFEGEFAVELASYFFKQGYEKSEVTLLCTYAAQQSFVDQRVRAKFGSDSGITVDTVDNYQGKENKIVIVSLVRSFPSEQIGFLGVRNRVCVALSRAQHGLYMVGNVDFLAYYSHMWSSIGKSLQEAECIGDALPLYCERHDTVQWVGSIDDFAAKVPNGGCDKACGVELKCGHQCIRLCHRDDEEHAEPCRKRVVKTCAREEFLHEREMECCESYGKCVTYEKKQFPCGHISDVVCHILDTATCSRPCGRALPCGHSCTNKCSTPCVSKCMQLVRRHLDCGHRVELPCGVVELGSVLCASMVAVEFPTCGHSATVVCSQIATARCRQPCGKPLPCGHNCNSECDSCTRYGCRGACNGRCNKKLRCGHLCARSCDENCDVGCLASCERECEHFKCGGTADSPNGLCRRCGDACVLCVAACSNRCRHRACTRRCWEPCDVEPCTHHCEITLACGHRCMGLCGEVCPDLCATCSPEIWKEKFGTASQKSKLLQLRCKCVMLVKEAEQAVAKQHSNREAICCPKCAARLSTKCCKRFRARVSEIWMFMETKKFSTLIGDETEYVEVRTQLSQRLTAEIDALSKKHSVKNPDFLVEISKVLCSLKLRLLQDRLNGVAAKAWETVMPDLVDVSKLGQAVVQSRYRTASQKKFPNLHRLFSEFFARSSAIGNCLRADFNGLVDFLRICSNAIASSMLLSNVGCFVRRIFVKHQLGLLITMTQIQKDCVDITGGETLLLATSIGGTIQAVNEKDQKRYFAAFVKQCRTIYEERNAVHLFDGADLSCLRSL